MLYGPFALSLGKKSPYIFFALSLGKEIPYIFFALSLGKEIPYIFFALSLWKEIPYIFYKFNPLNTDTPLIQTLSMAPSVSVLTECDCTVDCINGGPY